MAEDYTKTCETALNSGVRYSDRTCIDGVSKGTLDNGTPGIDVCYTGYHFTKTVCQTCGTIWNPCDLFKIDMPDELKEKQEEKAIKQAVQFLEKRGYSVSCILYPAKFAYHKAYLSWRFFFVDYFLFLSRYLPSV